MRIEISSTSKALIQKKANDLSCCWTCLQCCDCCCPCFGSCCCENEWRGKATTEPLKPVRYIELDYEGAWGEDSKLVMRINLPAQISVQQAQLWVSALQAASPKIMIGQETAAADMMRG